MTQASGWEAPGLPGGRQYQVTIAQTGGFRKGLAPARGDGHITASRPIPAPVLWLAL